MDFKYQPKQPTAVGPQPSRTGEHSRTQGGGEPLRFEVLESVQTPTHREGEAKPPSTASLRQPRCEVGSNESTVPDQSELPV